MAGVTTTITNDVVNVTIEPEDVSVTLGGEAPSDSSVNISGGRGITGGGSFTLNQSGNATLTLALDNGDTAALATPSDNGLLSATDKTKLDTVASGAEVNVNADWNASSGDAEILNKPTIPAQTTFEDDDAANTSRNLTSITFNDDGDEMTLSDGINSRVFTGGGGGGTTNDTTITIGAGIGLTGGGSFTTNQDTASTINVALDDTRVATTATSGLMSATDKSKLDTIPATAISGVSVSDAGTISGNAGEVTTLNFAGDGVTVAGTGATRTLTISGGGGMGGTGRSITRTLEGTAVTLTATGSNSFARGATRFGTAGSTASDVIHLLESTTANAPGSINPAFDVIRFTQTGVVRGLVVVTTTGTPSTDLLFSRYVTNSTASIPNSEQTRLLLTRAGTNSPERIILPGSGTNYFVVAPFYVEAGVNYAIVGMRNNDTITTIPGYTSIVQQGTGNSVVEWIPHQSNPIITNGVVRCTRETISTFWGDGFSVVSDTDLGTTQNTVLQATRDMIFTAIENTGTGGTFSTHVNPSLRVRRMGRTEWFPADELAYFGSIHVKAGDRIAPSDNSTSPLRIIEQ